VRAYFDRLAAVRLREVTEQTIALYEKQFADADERFRAGRVTKNEVLEVQVVLRNATQRRQREDLAVDRARWAFNRAIGVDVDAPTEVVDLRPQPAVVAASPPQVGRPLGDRLDLQGPQYTVS
jgi:outer membrane protein TolC